MRKRPQDPGEPIDDGTGAILTPSEIGALSPRVPRRAIPLGSTSLPAKERSTAAEGSVSMDTDRPPGKAMKGTHVQPWASGPGEILRHGLELLRKDTDTNRRLAMISIDNAVELMIKTYVGLPKRITGLSITRKELQEIGESFPALLDALEKYAPDRLAGVDLGTIEWYHRLRNELYHQGNGLTVERDKVEIYAELANVLFKNLFGYALVEDRARKTELLGEFLAAWDGGRARPSGVDRARGREDCPPKRATSRDPSRRPGPRS
jgi:hypothetical protein